MGHLLDIGWQLVAARRARGMSQRELGARVGVAQQQIARWETSGYRTASLGRTDSVARTLGLSVVAVPAPDLATVGGPALGATGVPPAGAGGPQVRDIEDVAELLRAYRPEIEERFGIASIGVFGAFASGRQTEASSVSLLVTGRQGEAPRLEDAAGFLEGILGRSVELADAGLLTERRPTRVLGEVVRIWPV